MTIIKRKKQSQFFMMSNHATQKELTSLNTIGLLAYIISLPEDFRLYKTYLQKKFTRRTVDNAFKELVEKKYIAGFSCYVDRKKEYYYIASDEQLNEKEFNIFVHESFYGIVNEKNVIPKNLQVIPDNQFEILIDFSNVQNVHQCDVQRVQYTQYSTSGTEPNVPIQRSTEKEIEKRNKTNINNNYPQIYNWLEN